MLFFLIIFQFSCEIIIIMYVLIMLLFLIITFQILNLFRFHLTH